MRHKSVPPPLTRRSMDTPVHLRTANIRGNHAAQECAASAHPQIGVTLTCCKRWPNSAGGGNSDSNDSNRLQA